jgi:DNA-binding NtrC family response regulator
MSWETRASSTPTLEGLRVLVVDDEMIIALDIECMLREAGAVVIGPACDVAEGLALARGESLSVAVLDVRLGAGTVEPLAEALFDRGVPFVFYSGQVLSEACFTRWPKAAFVAKPSPSRVLTEAIRRAYAASQSSAQGPDRADEPEHRRARSGMTRSGGSSLIA